MPETWQTRFARWAFNWFPAYRGTGARVTYIAADWREVRIRLPLNRRTRNYVGTIFGGSLYGAVDHVFIIMLIQLLGSEFVVWDKSAEIRFLKPGRTTLHATFKIEDEELEAIRKATEAGPVDRTYSVELLDAESVSHAAVTKTIYIRRKSSRIRT